MPFIPQVERDLLEQTNDPQTPGQRCFLWYRLMLKQWNRNVRWTTADDIFAWVRHPEPLDGEQRAKELAWQVFFVMKVMPYEEIKLEDNGDID